MRLTKDAKTNIACLLLGFYYASALPDVTMLVVEQPKLMEICNRVRTYSVYGIYLLAAYTLAMDFLDNRGKDITQDILSWIKRNSGFLIMFVVTVCIKFSTGYMLPLKFLMFMTAVRDTDLKKIFRILLGVYIVFGILVLAGYKAGLITDVAVPGRGNTVRHSLGFVYPLDLHGYYLSMVFMYMYIRSERFCWKDALPVILINVLLYTATKARTDLAVIIMASAVLVFVNKTGWDKVNARVAGICTTVYTLVLSVTPFILTAVYDADNAFMVKLNSVLTGRLKIQQRVIRETGYSLFGRTMEWIGWGAYDGTDRPDYNFVDCTFLKDTIDFGVIFEILFIIGMILLFIRLLKEKNISGTVIMVFFLLSCMIEYHTVLTYMYPILLLFSKALVNEGKEAV